MKTLKVLTVIAALAAVACNPNKANTQNTFCIANLGPEDTELVLEAANEWHEKTDGEVNFHFVGGDCNGYDTISNVSDDSLIKENRYAKTVFSPIATTQLVFDDENMHAVFGDGYSDMYRATVMHEMGHFLLASHFGIGWHSHVEGDIMKVGHYNHGVFHLSDHDIANFHEAQE
ncbi:MAG TPA: hypothetical protein V6C65_02335 [Allocoleopsis sp.]